MSDNIAQPIWLIGAGNMAVEYAKVLLAQRASFAVLGRGMQSAESFRERTGQEVVTGGLQDSLFDAREVPVNAIVAVSANELTDTTQRLIQRGVRRILVEKPAGLDLPQVSLLSASAQQAGAEVYVAYNRRFYSSVLRAKQMIESDGGIRSFHFEFTEWSHLIEKMTTCSEIKQAWFLGNSTHVVDLAFFLGGVPAEMASYSGGSLSWHPAASVFSGAGRSERGALFSYHADWQAPGRWGVELLTSNCRLILRPLEKLQLQRIGSTAIEFIELDDELDCQFKPGLYREVDAFLNGSISENLLPIQMHCRNFQNIYLPMLHSTDFTKRKSDK